MSPLNERMPISVITTIYNEQMTIRSLLDGIKSQTICPKELIIVDGGSSDNTIAIINEFINSGNDWVKLVIDPACSSRFSNSPIAKGRNVGIRAATQEIIAVTDASTIPDKNWLKRITTPLIENSADCVGGYYQIAANSIWGEYFALLFQPLKKDSQFFIPSSRSLAFFKKIWVNVSGYPGGYKYGEDTEFFLNIQDSGARIAIVPEAVTLWHPDNTDTWKGGLVLLFKYAKGNGQRNLFFLRYFRLFVFYAFFFFSILGVILGIVPTLIKLISFCFVVACLAFLVLRSWRIFSRRNESISKMHFKPTFVLYLISIDLADIFGFLSGYFDKFKNAKDNK